MKLTAVQRRKVEEAVLNGCLVEADGSPFALTSREVVRWLLSVRSLAWSVNGVGNHGQEWWATRMGVSVKSLRNALNDLSRLDEEEKEKGGFAVISVEVTKCGTRKPMITYQLTEEFVKYAVRYTNTTVAEAKTGRSGLAKAHRRYVAEGRRSHDLKNLTNLRKAVRKEEEGDSEDAPGDRHHEWYQRHIVPETAAESAVDIQEQRQNLPLLSTPTPTGYGVVA